MAADDGAVFVDHYAVFNASPDVAVEDLKKIYFDMVREYHPDKRPESAGATGQRITQSLNEAWDVLRDPQRKEAYDKLWYNEKLRSLPAHERADYHRRRGNELYGRARDLAKDAGVMNLASVHQSMQLYKKAMDEYSQAMEFAPNDHRWYSNRALCYLAVEDWSRARDDAHYCARLRPDFKKAWLLLTKALWKMGRIEEATVELQQGLKYLPGCNELLELQADFSREIGDASFKSRSVSPVYTPTASRNTTPTRSTPGRNRPVSPTLQAAGAHAAQRQGNAATYGGPSSRSPGPQNRAQAGSNLTLDASGTFQTGNFGAPTPSFAAGMASFPASAHTMWAGSASQRQAYSPGPAGASYAQAGPEISGSARESSRGRSGSQGARKSASLRGMLDSSRGNSASSRGTSRH
jgi:curved DNA-binding protein CbpA